MANSETGEAENSPAAADRRRSQPTVLVTGRASRSVRLAIQALFDERTAASDGAVIVTTCESPQTLVRRMTVSLDGVDSERLVVVDCRPSPGSGATETAPVRRLDPPTAPGVVSEAIGGARAWLDDAGADRRHVLYDTLAIDHQSADAETTYDHVHQLAMTVGAENGLAVFTCEADGVSGAPVTELRHLFDVHVEVRPAAGGPELRWTGLLGTSDGWVGLADADLGASGFR